MKTFSAALGAIAIFLAVPVAARELTATVRLSDLDLSNQRDAAKLRRRLASAIEQVCGSYATIERYDEDMVTSCRRAAQADIAREIPAAGSARGPQLARH